jgi:Protein of unknown function (DUF2911)
MLSLFSIKTIKAFAVSLCIHLFMNTTSQAQIQIPALSPSAKVEQQIGLGSVAIAYGRPSLRGRKLLGQANIPYGMKWRLGANEVTTITTTKDLIIAGNKLKKGRYAMIAIPDSNQWTIVINNDADQWGVYNYNKNKDVLRFIVKTQTLVESIETLTFTFEDIQPSNAKLVFRWQNSQFIIEIQDDADAEIMASIQLKTSVSEPNLEDLLLSSEYYLLMNRDLPQALAWIDKVLEEEKSPFRYNLKAEITQKLGRCDLTIASANQAIVYAQKNNDVAAIAKAKAFISICENK